MNISQTSQMTWLSLLFSSILALHANPAKKPALQFSGPQVKKIDELNEREIAMEADLDFTGHIPKKKWMQCVPRESHPFPKKLSEEQKKDIFTKKEVKDLNKCSRKDCAFNFLPYEVDYLQKLKPDERKKAYFKFYEDRVRGLTPMDPTKKDLMIRSKDHPFDFCLSPKLNKLLDDRPVSSLPFRLSHVHYDSRMRPTTRLLQGEYYQTKKGELCYAEALIFSDHYDIDRVELFGLMQNKSEGSIRLVIRHRIDFLNSWFRRLEKGSLRSALIDVGQKEMNGLRACLSK